MFDRVNLIALSVALVASVAMTACGELPDEPVARDNQASALRLIGLDGIEHRVASGALVEAADGVRWDTEVDGLPYVVDVRLGAAGDAISVTGPEGRLLFEAEQGTLVQYTGWMGDGAARFDRSVQLPEEPAKHTGGISRGVGDALSLPPADDFFTPLAEAGNTVAAPLALVALPFVLQSALGAQNTEQPGGSADEAFGTLEQPMWVAAGVLVAAFGIGVTGGVAFCMRSSTSASCTASDGVTSSVTCNACQGRATCAKVAISSDDIAIVLGEDGDDDDAYSCACSCSG